MHPKNFPANLNLSSPLFVNTPRPKKRKKKEKGLPSPDTIQLLCT